MRPAVKEKTISAAPDFRAYSVAQQLEGAWTVRFDPKWGGPAAVIFDTLSDWTKHPDEGIKFYSGKATYHKSFDLEERYKAATRLWIALGIVKNIASVRLNGKEHGIVWTSPWIVEITGAVKEKGNELEIGIVNLWPNRLIGDAALPPEKRMTRTNIELKKEARLTPSGLLGPVKIILESKME